MAIQDRNLSAGTKLTARYKGQTYTCEVVLNPTATGERPIAYRLADGREFKSPSAAGSAVMGGNACNGWAFWSLDTGEGQAATGPVRSSKPTVTPAPKPEPKKRGRKPATTTTNDEPTASEPAAVVEDEGEGPLPVTCAGCGETFPNSTLATEHYYATHGAPVAEEAPTA